MDLTVLCGHIAPLFPYFLVFHYPYILLRCFLVHIQYTIV